MDTFKLLMKNQVKMNSSTVKEGNIIHYGYVAKIEHFDRRPLNIVLRTTKRKFLCVALNWTPVVIRKALVDYIYSLNVRNVKTGKPLDISYKQIKPFLIKYKLKNIIRLYRKDRMSKRGVVIPNQYLKGLVFLDTASFTGGKSPEELYQINLKKAKAKRAKTKPTSKRRPKKR